MIAGVIALALRIWRSPELRHLVAGAALVLALVIGYFAFWHWVHERESAAAKAATDALQAKIDAATAAESQRRDQEIQQANAARDEAIARAKSERVRNASLVSAINRLSARNDGLPCWDTDAVDRLRRLIDQGGRKAGDGTAKSGVTR